MIPVTIAAIKIVRHTLLFDCQIVFAEWLCFYNARHPVCDLYAQSAQLLNLPGIIGLQSTIQQNA